MRIVIASQTYYPGNNGQAVFTIRLAEGLARRGHDVLAVVPSRTNRTYRQLLNGVQVEQLASLPLPFLHPEASLTLPAPASLRSFRPDVVHIQDHYPVSRSVLRMARELGWPTLGTNHFLPENMLYYFTRHPAWQAALSHVLWQGMLTVYNQLTAVTTPTETAAEILRAQAIQVPVYPISCGVDLSRFTPQPQTDRGAVCRKYGLDAKRSRVLYVGRLDVEKRLDLLIEAVYRLRPQPLQIILAGSGAHQEALQQKARQLGLGAQVVFLGYIPTEDLGPLLNSVDAFIMPSPQELQSIATLEAMATGRPILAANARALPELVTTGENGFLFEPNDVDAIVRALTDFMAAHSLWPVMGQASLARAQRHSLENTIAQYADLYHLLACRHLPEVAPQPIIKSKRQILFTVARTLIDRLE